MNPIYKAALKGLLSNPEALRDIGEKMQRATARVDEWQRDHEMTSGQFIPPGTIAREKGKIFISLLTDSNL